METSIKMFADGASLTDIGRLASDPRVAGFTTNPTLMRAAGVESYREFAMAALEIVGDSSPISFEVVADDFDEMRRQAFTIASWGPNVYVKIPITDSAGRSSTTLIADLGLDGVKVNVTALMTVHQVRNLLAQIESSGPLILSMFAGRIADAGVDPVPIMSEAAMLCHARSNCELLWASPREILNVVQAEQVGCDIITMTPNLFEKLELLGTDLASYSLETVRMFMRDATAAGYEIT